MSDEKTIAITSSSPESLSINTTTGTDTESQSQSPDQPWDSKSTARLLRKLDRHIIPFMSLIYLLSFLDRANIGNARLDNLEGDLGLKGLQYNHALGILFPFYIASEIPSNLMMKRIRPSLWMTFIMVCWSLVMVSQGFVKNYAGLMVTRTLLGVFEGGLFPGATYYITSWYCRHEAGFRLALFFSCSTLAGAFGGILARGIAEMRGVGGLPAWSWIFILEGLLTLLVSLAAPWAIYDSTETARFLNDQEKNEVRRRIDADHGKFNQAFDKKYIYQAFKDWKIYIHCGINVSALTPLYSFSMFLPTIIRNMGYTANNAQLMSVPPYVVACFFTVLASWVGDRYRQRAVIMIFFQCIALAGLAMLISTTNPGVQYGGTVLAAVGIFPQVPLGLAWNSGNMGGSLKRATGIAMQVMGGNSGGLIAAYVYLATDGPRFIKGHGILIGFVTMGMALSLFMTVWCRRENARRDALQENDGKRELTEEEVALEQELADKAPWFRYQV